MYFFFSTIPPHLGFSLVAAGVKGHGSGVPGTRWGDGHRHGDIVSVVACMLSW